MFRARGTCDLQRPPNRREAITHPGKTRAPAFVGTPAAFVDDLDDQHPAVAPHIYPSRCGRRVLGHVREALGTDVVDRCSNVGRSVVNPNIEQDGNRGTAGEAREHVAQASRLELARPQAPPDLVEVMERGLEVSNRQVQVPGATGPDRGRDPAQVVDEVREGLFGPTGQSDREPVPLCVGRQQQAAGRPFDVRDGGGNASAQLDVRIGEAGRALYGVDARAVTQDPAIVDDHGERPALERHRRG